MTTKLSIAQNLIDAWVRKKYAPPVGDVDGWMSSVYANRAKILENAVHFTAEMENVYDGDTFTESTRAALVVYAIDARNVRTQIDDFMIDDMVEFLAEILGASES